MITADQLDTITRAYLAAALWSSTGENEQPLDGQFGLHDIAPEALQSAREDCGAFLNHNRERLALAGLDDEQAGHDFWLSRNGHGAGFFDRANLGTPERAACDLLQKDAQGWGESDLYAGDDGKLYLS